MYTLGICNIFAEALIFSVITDDVLDVKRSALVGFAHCITEIISQSHSVGGTVLPFLFIDFLLMIICAPTLANKD